MEWYFYRGGTQGGPISEEELFKMGSDGRLEKNDLVWNSGMSDWTPAGEIPGLTGSAAVQPDQPAGHFGSEKELIIGELLALSDAGPFNIAPGPDTDLVVTNEVADSSWFSGKKKVTYSARLLLNEEEKTAYYWEMLKESSSGLSFQMGMQKKKIKGIELFQQSREKGYAPGGELVYDYQFDYGSLREAFRRLVESRGWKFKVVIMPGKTTYR
jgi:hypothetical protein